MSITNFDLHSTVVGDYRDFVRSFFLIADDAAREYVDRSLVEEARLWPDSLLQVGPSYVRTETVDDLAGRGLLHEQAAPIFRNDEGQPFHLYQHQVEAMEAARIGAEYHEHRRQIMLARNQGLTATYNLFHNPECTDADIQRLRELHAEMDLAVLACYGWQDLECAHGFHENERGQTRFTISPEARRDLLRRLLELNLELSR